MVVASSSPSFPHHPVFLFASLIGMTELHGETMPPGHGCSELRAISTATPGPPLALSGQRSIGGARAKQKLARHDARGSGHWSPDHRSRRWGRERRGQYRRADAGASEDFIAGASARRRRTQQPRLLCPQRELQSLRLQWSVLHLSRRLVVLRYEPQRPVGFHRARAGAQAGRRGAGELLQDPSGPRQEDGASSGGTSRSAFRGLVPSGASEEGPLLTPVLPNRPVASVA